MAETDGERLSDQDFLAISARISRHYAEALAQHGPTARGVDWENARLQQVRLARLMTMVDVTGPISLNDLGCGYGALLGYLQTQPPAKIVDYLGIDAADTMVRTARDLWRMVPHSDFVVGITCPRQADYGVASGIFNVQLDHPTPVWELYVARVLDNLHATSRIGFAVNFRAEAHPGLSSSGLYETRPDIWVRFCQQRYSAAVQIVADYGLREFTLLVRANM